jgi:AcrR family transcriptional regulator
MRKQRNKTATPVGIPREDSTRGRILGAAERLFAEHGFNSVSMPAIATASGITAGAIYKHFDSKADLFFEVIQHTVQATPVPPPEGTSDVMYLPSVIATYSTGGLKLLRQLAVEVHSASVKHARVRRLLRRSLDLRIAQIKDTIASAQRAGQLDPALDSEMLASTVMVFTMGLMHVDTVVPRLIDDAKWHDFIKDRVAALLGVPRQPGRARDKTR